MRKGIWAKKMFISEAGYFLEISYYENNHVYEFSILFSTVNKIQKFLILFSIVNKIQCGQETEKAGMHREDADPPS